MPWDMVEAAEEVVDEDGVGVGAGRCWGLRMDRADGEVWDGCVCGRGWGEGGLGGNMSSREGWASMLGAAGREEDRRDDIHLELTDVREALCGEEAAEWANSRGGVESGSGVLVLLVMVGDVEDGRGVGCGGEREEIGKAGDNEGVANGLNFGRGASWGPPDGGGDVSPFGGSESRSSSGTSLPTAAAASP